MATPSMGGDGVLALIPEEPLSSIDPSSSSPSSPVDCAKTSAEESPILIFLFFQKAIRSELDRLHRAAVALATGGGGDVESLEKRCKFLFSIYKHHCNAEDEVIFPALDIRVKNVARTYSLEHQGERNLFGQLFDLLNSATQNNDNFLRELASCTGAICTSLNQHMSKEEEQVFPLLIEKFTFEEQADLIWQFFCSIPLNMMGKFFPWLSSCISPDEHQDILKCLCNVVPEEELLQQVVVSWMESNSTGNPGATCTDDPHFQNCLSSGPGMYLDQAEKQVWECEHSKTGKRKHTNSDCHAVDSTVIHPINEILHWHNAIKWELNDILEVARKMQLTGDFSDLSSFDARLQFIADVCIFHSIAEDQVIFPAVDREHSFVQEHSGEENQINSFRFLIKKILNVGAKSTSVKFYSELCLHADQIMDAIKTHCQNEETKVLPIARSRFCPEKQRELLYKSICVMPLKLLERVLPWFFATLSKEEARFFLQNLQMAAPASDCAMVTLLSDWACKGHSQDISNSESTTCLSSKAIGDFSSEEEDCSQPLCANSCSFSAGVESSLLQAENDVRPVKRVNFSGLCGNIDGSQYSDTGKVQQLSNRRACCEPGLGVNSSNLGVVSPASSKSFSSLSHNSSVPSVSSSLFTPATELVSLNLENTERPIDNIFKFHKALCKDLEFLDVESGKILGCDESFLRHFSGRFRLLWGLYKAHSNAEDDIVFPALESREALHNVSHSYTLDHKQEEKLFEDIFALFEELSELHSCFDIGSAKADATGVDFGCSSHRIDWTRKQNELATRLQGMCKSLRVSLEHHVFREEIELWPLFDKHFSVEEQEKIVGRIIGTTGAEVLQSMLPWVTSALTLEEQNNMMDTWKQATKNTMFNEWLNEWWKQSPTSSQAAAESNIIPKGSEYQESLEQNETFKPGWKDIFRMNQSELESEIRKVSQDPTLDPRRKAYLIQNLMTSRWIAAQQKLPQVSAEDGEDVLGCSPSFRDPEKQVFGCEHYKRNCKLRAACCNKLFACRFCHDKVSDHSMDRKASTEMLCMRCLKVQPVGPTCKTPSCNAFSMAKYFCHICKFFDDERTIYHCPSCNLCRVGKGLGIDFFHCMGCNVCLGLKLVEHRCREKVLEMNCPICCDFLFTSTAPLRALRCGHFMHSACFQAYTCTHYTCPICSKSLGDMAVYFGMLDALLSAEELPEEYRDLNQDILCNDCNRKGKARFHWLYHKCSSCGSYNSRVIKSEVIGCFPSNQ